MINNILLYNSGGGIGDSVQLLPFINTLKSELKNAKTEEDFSSIGAVAGESPMSYSRFEVGWTKQGFQVWCTRHNTNVIHIDFDDITNVKKLAEQHKKNQR